MTKQIRIILVDSDIDNLKYISVLLKSHFSDIFIEIYSNAKRAINRIQRNNFDIVITELNFNDDGYDGWDIIDAAYFSGKSILILSNTTLFQKFKIFFQQRSKSDRLIYLNKSYNKKDLFKYIEELLPKTVSETCILKRTERNLMLY